MTEELRALIEAPTKARRLYERGGFEELEPFALQVLIAVQLLGEPTVGELVGELALGQGTVSTALTKLADRDLVTAAPDPADRRRQRQRITRGGRALVRRFARATCRRFVVPGPLSS